MAENSHHLCESLMGFKNNGLRDISYSFKWPSKAICKGMLQVLARDRTDRSFQKFVILKIARDP